ncbi:MAG TPA: hypothetical protein VEA99_11890 [Gemmatimonadaceae bacterium]|nr:hypothetical protein [Gemmatimonadaceae bacterium]
MEYPLELSFKLLALAPQIAVRDAREQLVCYVRQKMFKLKESVTVFADEAQTRPMATIVADRWLDFSARYRISDASGRELGIVQRRGMRSLWKAHYEVERGGMPLFEIAEANPWVKLIDGVVGEIPVVGMFTGYWLHPAYRVTHVGMKREVLRATKRPALWEGRYEIERFQDVGEEEERLATFAIIMMLLLERTRG